MNETLKTGLELLAVGLAFAGMFALNMKTGHAILRAFVSADRRTSPFGFWLIQTIIGVFAVALLIAAASQLIGSFLR